MSYCTPCPPCDTNFPLLCEPLETTANGKRLVVEDSAACQKTIQTPVTQQVLKTDGAGNLTWTNGASGTVLRKDSTGLLEFATLNSVLQSGPVDLGSQPLTTTGTAFLGPISSSGEITATGNIVSSNMVACKLLDVTNVSGNAAIEVGAGVGGQAYIDFKVPNPDDNDIRIGTNGGGGYISTSGNGDISMLPGGTGKVGIGSSAPVAKLHIDDSGDNTYIGQTKEKLENGTISSGSIYFGDNFTNPTAGIESSYLSSGTNPSISIGVTRDGNKTRLTASYDNRIKFYTNNVQNMEIRPAAISFNTLFTFANNAAAIAGGLAVGDLFIANVSGEGQLRIVI
jgi:hypothetical protein